MRREIVNDRLITLAAVWVVLSVAGAGVARAGTPTDPEIIDPAGDANGVSAYLTGAWQGDTRPASIDSADLRAVWFETAYGATQLRDPETGEVVRVEYKPTGVRINIRTEAPIHPTWQGQTTLYQVAGDIQGGNQAMYFVLRANQAQGTDVVKFYPCPTCAPSLTGSVAYSGTTATLSFSYANADIAQKLAQGNKIQFLKALSYIPGPTATEDRALTGQHLWLDGTFGPADFIVGEDLPADVDCTETPDHPECES